MEERKTPATNQGSNEDMEAAKGNTKTLPNPKLVFLLDNPYVKSIAGDKVFYKKDFYVSMYKKMEEEHLTAIEAYEVLGFPVDVLGKERAEQAGKNARNKFRTNRLNAANPANYDGTIPLSNIPDSWTIEEKNAYMTARIAYLEALVEAQKKIPYILAERYTS